jgi:hypothetical protein
MSLAKFKQDDHEGKPLLQDVYRLLAADPARQAVDTILAYDYQIWHSLLAWINLQKNELLYLEGAEDFDKYNSNGVTVTQIKHSNRKVTLRSDEIIESINNFWKLKEKNADQNIHLLFLTVAEATRERGQPFGEKIGLDLWEECKSLKVDPDPLRRFLIEHRNISCHLRKVLALWTADDFRRELLLPITWATGSPPFSRLQEEVNKALVYHGSDMKLVPRVGCKTS